MKDLLILFVHLLTTIAFGALIYFGVNLLS